jgi:hypothetical protein
MSGTTRTKSKMKKARKTKRIDTCTQIPHTSAKNTNGT